MRRRSSRWNDGVEKKWQDWMKQWRQEGEPVLRKQTVYCDGRRGAGGGGIATESIRVQVVTPALVHDLHGDQPRAGGPGEAATGWGEVWVWVEPRRREACPKDILFLLLRFSGVG
jgi:hypothetical protein